MSSESKNARADVVTAFWVALWYLNSGVVLLLNKHLLSRAEVHPQLLTVVQMGSTLLYGGMSVGCVSKRPAPGVMLQLLPVGLGRFLTIALGLVSLQHVAASFTETVKSSAPFFTVLFSLVILREPVSRDVLLTLVPIVAGLGLTSATELSFNLFGFLAAAATNLIECFQNVFSKYLLLSKDNFSPMSLQFYTSVAAMLMQAPVFFYLGVPVASTPTAVLPLLVVDGLLFHCQSVVAYVVMDRLQPVSVSVLNAVKIYRIKYRTLPFSPLSSQDGPFSVESTQTAVKTVSFESACRDPRNRYQMMPTSSAEGTSIFCKLSIFAFSSIMHPRSSFGADHTTIYSSLLKHAPLSAETS